MGRGPRAHLSHPTPPVAPPLGSCRPFQKLLKLVPGHPPPPNPSYYTQGSAPVPGPLLVRPPEAPGADGGWGHGTPPAVGNQGAVGVIRWWRAYVAGVGWKEHCQTNCVTLC